MGARWDADARNWRLDGATDPQLTEMRSWPGCSVSNRPMDAERVSELVNLAINSRPIRRAGEPVIYGDDASYFNTFRETNPPAFFGFSSLPALIRYVEAIPSDMRNNAGWNSTDADWSGTRHMSGALKLAREGWAEGLANAEEIADMIAVDHMRVKRRSHGLAGGSVNVGRLLSGNPLHMRQRPKQPGRKVVTLFAETFMSAAIDPDNAIARAAIVAAMADVMERNGYSCEIVGIVTTSGPDYQIAVTLKHAGEKLNLADLVFALGHPAFFRRMLFAVNGSAPETRSSWRHMGFPSSAFDATFPTRRNEFYIRQLTIGKQRQIDETNLRSRVETMIPFVFPENLE